MLSFLTENAGIFLLLLTVAVVGVGVWAFWLQQKMKGQQSHHDQVLKAVEEEGIEGVLTQQARDLTRLSHDAEELYRATEEMQMKLTQALTNISVIRYNPFNDAGGNQSFVCAMLDDHKTGIVISSLHHRSGNRIYAKPIIDGVSEFQLSNEENEAIQRAMTEKASPNVKEDAEETEAVPS